MYYKNKGVIGTIDQDINIDNESVNLIELESIKKDTGFPSDTVGKSAVLIIYDMDKENKYLYILIDEIGREYYLRHEVSFDVKHSKFILASNQVLDRWWQSIAMEDDPDTSYEDITTVITNIAPRYNPDEVNRLVDELADRSVEQRYFKREGANNTVPTIHHFHQFPRVNCVDPVIRMTVSGGRNSNTDYRIWYHNWQGGWEDAIVMAAWRNSWMTEMRFGTYSDWDAEDVEIHHSIDRIVVRHRENGHTRNRDVLMNYDLLWKHLGNPGSGGSIGIPQNAVDIMIVPRFISCLDISSLPVLGDKTSIAKKHAQGAISKEVPLGYNPFIGYVFDFDLPCFYIPAGVDYGLHGTSYTLTSRANRQLTFGPGSLSHDATFGRFRDGRFNYGIRYPWHHYEVWWR